MSNFILEIVTALIFSFVASASFGAVQKVETRSVMKEIYDVMKPREEAGLWQLPGKCQIANKWAVKGVEGKKEGLPAKVRSSESGQANEEWSKEGPNEWPKEWPNEWPNEWPGEWPEEWSNWAAVSLESNHRGKFSLWLEIKPAMTVLSLHEHYTCDRSEVENTVYIRCWHKATTCLDWTCADANENHWEFAFRYQKTSTGPRILAIHDPRLKFGACR